MKNKCHRVENVRKGENARIKQFLLFSQCFPQHISLERQNAASCGNGLTLSSIYTYSNTLKKKSLEKHCGKR